MILSIVMPVRAGAVARLMVNSLPAIARYLKIREM
jgi:hypothetical protein